MTAEVSGTSNTWLIFVSYRRPLRDAEGTVVGSTASSEVADWLKKELEGEQIESNTGQVFELSIFVDEHEPSHADWREKLLPTLAHSRAVILLVDRAAAERKPGKDYLYEELEWLLGNKRQPIILQLDTVSRAALVAKPEFKVWENVNTLDCFWDAWKKLDAIEVTRNRIDLLNKVRDSVREHGSVRHNEEIQRLREAVGQANKATRRARRRATVALVLLILAIMGVIAAIVFAERATSAFADANFQRAIAVKNAWDANTANIKLSDQIEATKKADSRSDRETAQRLLESADPAQSVAYLCRALERDPKNLPALADLMTRLTETAWFYPASPSIQFAGQIVDIAWSPDSHFCAVAIRDDDYQGELSTTTRVGSRWRVFQIGADRTLSPGAEIVSEKRLRFSADGHRLVEFEFKGDEFAEQTSTMRPTGCQWNALSGQLQEKTDRVLAPVATSSPRFRVAIEGRTIRVLNRKGKRHGMARYAGSPVDSASVSPDGRFVVAETHDEKELDIFQVEVWRVGQGENDANSLQYQIGDRLQSAHFSRAGNYLLLDLYEGNDPILPAGALLQLSANNTEEAKLTPFFAKLRVAEFSPDGQFILCGHAEGDLVLWLLKDPALAAASGESSSPQEPEPIERHAVIAGLAEKREAIALRAADLTQRGLPVPTRANPQAPDVTHGWASVSGPYALIEGEQHRWEVWDVRHRSRTSVSFDAVSLESGAFREDERAAVFESRTATSGGDFEKAIHVFNFETGQTSTFPLDASADLDGLTFSKGGHFVIFVERKDASVVTVLEASRLEPVARYHSSLQDRLWATEEIHQFKVTPEFLAIATALAGKRLSAEGHMENLSPDEWFRLRTGSQVGDSSLSDRIMRWLLQWPEEKTDSF